VTARILVLNGPSTIPILVLNRQPVTVPILVLNRQS
jgi:hypothetical protein